MNSEFFYWILQCIVALCLNDPQKYVYDVQKKNRVYKQFFCQVLFVYETCF